MVKNNTKLTNAINFLLFCYFGITLESKYPDILDKIISKAYKDATQQGAFNTQLTDVLKEKIEKAKNSSGNKENNLGENLIKDSIIKLVDIPYEITEKEKYQNQFNEWHNTLCNGLIDLYKNELNNDEFFTYGNAQKWVNMTMKYLYLINSVFTAYADPNNEFNNKSGKYIDNISEFLHIPVDRFIIDAAWNLDKRIELPIKDRNPERRIKGYKNPHEYVEPWSKWKNTDAENGTYSKFQKTLKEFLNEKPIDWECRIWNENADKKIND